MKQLYAVLACLTLLTAGCSAGEAPKAGTNDSNSTNLTFFPVPAVPNGAEVITLGAGCFWCTEAIFQQVPGVLFVTSGYMGGTTVRPTYKQVCTGDTGHAEVSRIVFDPKKTSLEKILAVFWEAHDPTSLNRQGDDRGTQYRSAIFYNTEEQRLIAEKCKTAAAKEYSKPIVTQITKAGEFYPAEDYHQNYYQLNKDINPYCTLVISPKLKKLGLRE
jgi:peptide-methionine (S)-S-oxide reductase